MKRTVRPIGTERKAGVVVGKMAGTARVISTGFADTGKGGL